MTKFEEIGQKYQMQAYDVDYAKWSFENSCHICCSRGLHINCSNAQLGGRFKYPIVARDNLCYVRQEGK